MAFAANELTTQLAERLAELRNSYGDSVDIGEIADVVGSLMATMDGDISAVDFQIRREILALVDYIERAKREITAIDPREIRENKIPAATSELEAVINATEEATNSILDAAEMLTELGNGLDPENAKIVEEITIRIYEASNFQDITGQRINKVISVLQHIEEKVLALSQATGDPIGKSVSDAHSDSSDLDEAELLNGPETPENANSQDEIDALFAGFD